MRMECRAIRWKWARCSMQISGRVLLYDEYFPWQPTMFQPVGGMDHVAAAFEKRVGRMIRFQSEVTQIRKTPGGVRVAYRDLKTKANETVEADYCICSIPMSVLASIDADFSPDVKQIIDHSPYDSAYKIAGKRSASGKRSARSTAAFRFLDRPVNLVWYPSARLFSKRGVVIAGYNVENGTVLEKMSVAEKLESSRQSVEALHPGRSRELQKPIYVGWGRIAYNLGSWVHINEPATYAGYERMIQPDGRIFFAGDHISHLVGWQEGAALARTAPSR